jgi:hypothetical protein
MRKSDTPSTDRKMQNAKWQVALTTTQPSPSTIDVFLHKKQTNSQAFIYNITPPLYISSMIYIFD